VDEREGGTKTRVHAMQELMRLTNDARLVNVKTSADEIRLAICVIFLITKCITENVLRVYLGYYTIFRDICNAFYENT
jgi:hypothetical protein